LKKWSFDMPFPSPIEGAFPKKCSSCGTEFESMIGFYEKTQSLAKDGSIVGRGKILLPRNCKCGTTLTIQIHERRDLSEAGDYKRNWIGSEIKRIRESIMTDYFIAKKLAIENFEKIHKTL